LYPWQLGNCLFDTVNVSVDGQSQGSYTYFDGCPSVNNFSSCAMDDGYGCGYNTPNYYATGGGGGGTTSAPPKPAPPTQLAGGTMHSGTTVCGGPSVFSAVGPNQALGGGSLSPAIQGHQAGGVAINPAIFGLQVGVKGTTAATIYYADIGAIAPQNIKLNGYPGPP
jgi:hypothetical protein